MEFYYHDTDQEVLILAADGGLNHETAEQLVAELSRLIDTGARKVIVDCTQLTYISNYGIGILIRLHKTLARQGGDVKLAAVDSPIVKLMERTHLCKTFDLYPDVQSAREAFRPPE